MISVLEEIQQQVLRPQENSTTRIATTAFVSTAVANLVDSAPDTLNTLAELATSIGNNATLSSTLTTSIATKLPLAGGTLTGNLNLGEYTSTSLYNDTSVGYKPICYGGLTLAKQATSVSDPVLLINNTGTAGQMIDLRQDGTTVGSIGTLNSGEDLYLNATDDLVLQAGGNTAIAAFQSSGSLQNVSVYTHLLPSGAHDLGSSGGKWRNLWLSGNIGVSGTVDGIDIAARDAVLTSTTTTAGAALPKAGGTMTGDLLFGAGGEIQFGGSNQMGLFTSSGTSHLRINSGIFKLRADDMRFTAQNGTTEFMRIDSSGKILIGDSASHTSDLLQIETPASGGGHGIQIRRNDSNTDQGVGRIQFGNNTATDLASISAKTDGATDNAALLFNTSVSSGANTERMRIDSSGNVVVLGTTPNSGGHSSWANLSMGTKGSLLSSRGAGGIYGMIVTDNLYIPAATGSLTYRTTNEASYYMQEAGEHRWYNAPSGSAGATAHYRTHAHRCSGNVGIGTAAPTAKLHVNYSVNASVANLAEVDNYSAARFGPFRADTDDNLYFMSIGGSKVGIQARDSTANGVTKVLSLNPFGGNVGIGTTTPSTKLTVKNSTATDGNNIADFVGSDTGQRLIVANFLCGSDEDRVGLYWENQGTINMRMWMADTGNLYLNSSNPSNDTDGSRVLLAESNGNTIVGTQIHFNNATNSSFIGAASTVNLRYAADGYHRFDTYNGSWGERVQITDTGCLPGSDSTYDLGSPSLRWANVYTGDLHLSNEEKGGNEVDGTTGNWTIQEGDENLYIKNNKTGKKYKFALEEIV